MNKNIQCWQKMRRYFYTLPVSNVAVVPKFLMHLFFDPEFLLLRTYQNYKEIYKGC